MLSVIIIAKNEALNIQRCLESVQWADEIIVLDSGSSDNTVDIAKQYTTQVYSTDWQGYGVQKQRALGYVTQPWVLNLDADESVSDALKADIQAIIRENRADACRIPIQMHFEGKRLRHSSSPSRHARLFKKEGAFFSPDLVHEKIILPEGAKVIQLKTPIFHHSFRDVSHAIEKMNRYSSYSAKMRRNSKKQISLTQTLLSSSWMFFRCYVLQRGFMDGRVGFLFACLNAQGSFFRGIKQLYPDRERGDL